MGNQWAGGGGPDAAAQQGVRGVVTGSHLDSVPDGGAFDGPLGVVSALAAVGPDVLAQSAAPLTTAVGAGDLDGLVPAVRIGGRATRSRLL